MSSAEYITHLASIRGDAGDSRIIAGTRSRIFANTGLDRNWRVLRDKAGGTRPEVGVPATRWKSTQVGNITMFTNNMDEPLHWRYEAPPDPSDGQAARPIDDLIAMDVTAARVIGSWRGFAFLGGLKMEGASYPNRWLWSDFNAPLAFAPLPDSLAGYADLDADETILAAAPLGGQYRMYSNKAIYDVNLVGGTEVFNIREVYRGPGAIRFENSLVDIGGVHLYGGEDTIYALGEFDRSPRSVDWLHKAAGAIYEGVRAEYLSGIPASTFGAFGGVNRSACHAFIGGYNEPETQVWFSWCADDEVVPTRSLVLQMDTQKASIVDQGFTAFVSHLPKYHVSVRRWLDRMGICDARSEGEGLMLREGNPTED